MMRNPGPLYTALLLISPVQQGSRPMAEPQADLSFSGRATVMPPRLRFATLLPWFVLALSLALTADLWRNDRDNADRVLQSDFDFRVRETLDLIEQRVAVYQQVLHGVQGLFASSANVSPQEFHDYVAALRLRHSHPAIQGIGFVPASSSTQGAYFNGGQPAPFDPGIYNEPVQRDAMESALERADIAFSGKLALVSVARGKALPGFVMYLPVFAKDARARAALLGWVTAPILIDELMRPAGGVEAFELDVEIYDGEELTGPRLLFDTDNWPMHIGGAASRYMSFQRLQMANRAWTIAVRSLPRFEARLDSSGTVKAWFGAATSVLLAGFAWLLAGSRARAVQIARDMNRRLIEREMRYRLIAENTGDVIWMMDATTLHFTYLSPSVERQRGYTPEEVMALHRNARSSETGVPVPPSMQGMEQRLRERIARFMAGDESQRHEINELDQRHKDGHTIPVEVESTLLCDKDNVPHAVVGVSRDITVRRQAQEEQKRFVAMISHEFRTPLATIDGAVQRLQATAASADDATRKRYEKIQQATDRLTALLDDYLTQERIDTAGQGLHLSEASPLALLRDSADSAHALSAGHVITIEASGAPEAIRADTDRLRLALRVLADNAVKYTPPGSHIVLYVRQAYTGIEFEVADNGAGIPDHELPFVFDKFFRGQGASQQTGSGLGLHMARAVAEMHGGTLTACNRPEGGARFLLWLPA
jgi:two-component system, OmpR family, phosphate regulon sensor histidine kinase PhoR